MHIARASKTFEQSLRCLTLAQESPYRMIQAADHTVALICLLHRRELVERHSLG